MVKLCQPNLFSLATLLKVALILYICRVNSYHLFVTSLPNISFFFLHFQNGFIYLFEEVRSSVCWLFLKWT